MLESPDLPTARHPGTAFLFRKTGDRLYLHHHREAELNVVLSGTAACLVGDRRLELERGDVLWLMPGTVHALVRQDRGFSMWVAWFGPALVARARAELPPGDLTAAEERGWSHRRLGARLPAPLVAALTEAAAGRQHPVRAGAALTQTWFQAWDACAGLTEASPGATLHPAVERALRLLTTGDDTSVAQLARRCGLSANRLSTLFADQVGHTIAAWRNRRRLDRFLADFKPGTTTVQAAALAAGFGSYASFHRVFRQHLSCSPRRWPSRG